MVLSTAARFGLLSLLGASTASAGLSRTTVKEEAAIKDAATECTYYDFPAVNAIVSPFPPSQLRWKVRRTGRDDGLKRAFRHLRRRQLSLQFGKQQISPTRKIILSTHDDA